MTRPSDYAVQPACANCAFSYLHSAVDEQDEHYCTHGATAPFPPEPSANLKAYPAYLERVRAWAPRLVACEGICGKYERVTRAKP